MGWLVIFYEIFWSCHDVPHRSNLYKMFIFHQYSTNNFYCSCMFGIFEIMNSSFLLLRQDHSNSSNDIQYRIPIHIGMLIWENIDDHTLWFIIFLKINKLNRNLPENSVNHCLWLIEIHKLVTCFLRQF